jgi:glycine cleavage system regulatory protein
MITSFKFIFILHLMMEIMGTTDHLCQHLQQKSQDILNAMQLVSSTKTLLQKLRNEDCDNLLDKVVSFFKKFEINITDLSARYVEGRGRHQRDRITVEHHYHFDIFNATIDFQLQELNSRFGERVIELLTLSLLGINSTQPDPRRR